MFTSCLRAPNSHQLSDTVIGGVVQRSRALNRVFYHGGTDRKRSQEVLTSDAVVVGTPPASKRQRFVSPHKSPRSVEEDNCAPEYNVERVVLADCTSGSAPQHGKESKRRLTARERNRNKQRRYRQKQYDLISSLEEDTQRLRDEIN
ncbi:hypothetical protein ON010_g1296 [Phytophthora cinnamomi]|nr:hypothetical protein ON010_g1296 [Phytophthora cinnamomi]